MQIYSIARAKRVRMNYNLRSCTLACVLLKYSFDRPLLCNVIIGVKIKYTYT